MPVALLTSSYKNPHATYNISMRKPQVWNETALMGEDKRKKMSFCFFSLHCFECTHFSLSALFYYIVQGIGIL